MIGRVLTWILDREPVAAATGLAGGVSAVIGVLGAWNIWEPTETQISAIAALVTWLAGYLARRRAWSPATVRRTIDLRGGGPDHE